MHRVCWYRRPPHPGPEFSYTLGTHHLISGGGGLEFLLLANFFFLPPRENNLFFWRSTSKEIFCRMLSQLYTLPFGFFPGQHIFHQFRQQTFFTAHISNKLFFLTFVATNYLFQFFLGRPPPPPRYQIVRPLRYIVSPDALADINN